MTSHWSRKAVWLKFAAVSAVPPTPKPPRSWYAVTRESTMSRGVEYSLPDPMLRFEMKQVCFVRTYVHWISDVFSVIIVRHFAMFSSRMC